ncbi:MAG TPA: hypothetical protein VND65_22270 [Candidatus Binatia bacterium]|nr:hypothetical protein [Candidatus Binatia bacterium]
MFHMEAFSSSLTTGTAQAFQQLNYVNVGNIIPPLNNGLNIPNQLRYLHSVFPLGVSMTMCRPQTPAFLPWPYWTLGPVNRGTTFESPPRVWDFSRNPIALNPTDELDIFAAQNSGGAETDYVAVNMSDGQLVAAPQGRMFTVHGTAAVTLNASAWTTVSWTFDQTIPSGRYAIIGGRCFAAHGKFWRIIPTEAPNYRPGGHMVQTYDALDAHGQRGWDYLGQTGQNWGVWVYTNSYIMPQCELFSTSADTAEEIFFDMVLVGPPTAIQGI